VHNLGLVYSCVGPIIDIKIKCNVLRVPKVSSNCLKLILTINSDLFLSCVYDSILLFRPKCNFRDGTIIQNYNVKFVNFFVDAQLTTSSVLSILNICCANYAKSYSFHFYKELFMELREMRSGSIVLGFISSFLFLKPYANNLVSEISQLCYGGILRSISLSTTDGLSTFECYTIFVWQPIIVPVGKLSLGRILNVVGSSIDSFTEINLSCMF
jgi:hypothetical protein